MNWLDKYIDYKGISVFAFEKKIGVRSTIAKAISANSNLGSNLLAKIIVEFPDINPYLLITGKGEMLRKQENSYQIVENVPMMVCEPGPSYGVKEIFEPVNNDKDKLIATLQQFVNELKNDKIELQDDKNLFKDMVKNNFQKNVG